MRPAEGPWPNVRPNVKRMIENLTIIDPQRRRLTNGNDSWLNLAHWWWIITKKPVKWSWFLILSRHGRTSEANTELMTSTAKLISPPTWLGSTPSMSSAWRLMPTGWVVDFMKPNTWGSMVVWLHFPPPLSTTTQSNPKCIWSMPLPYLQQLQRLELC